MVPVIVILVLSLTVAFFYLKCSMMQSFMTLWSAVIATIITFSYYEWLADLLISRGSGLNWALFGCFLVAFIVIFAVLRSASEFFARSNVDLGNAVKMSTALICGLLTGLIISGNLLVALGFLPMHGKVFYSQFEPGTPIVLKNPKTSALSTDGFVTGLYNRVSAGSMSSGKSFGVFHADYLSQIHLNKLKTKDDVLSVCSREALILPRDKGQKPVRLQTVDDEEVIIVRVGVWVKDIEKGGAGRDMKFFPAQIRLIVKEAGAAESPMAGTATALYPVGFWKNGALTKSDLNKIIAPDSKEIRDKVFWMDVAFQAPEKMKPVLLEFKQNAVVDLVSYEAVKNTPEIERALDNDGQKEESL